MIRHERATVIAIVEGHGEVQAVPVLVRAIAAALGMPVPAVPPPVRVPRGRISKPPGDDLARGLQLAARRWTPPGGLLLLCDADDDCAASLGPELRRQARAIVPEVRVEVVLAVREYEAWFLGALDSLRGPRDVRADAVAPPDAEAIRGARERFADCLEPARSYAETVDQPRFTARMDMGAARARCRSFDRCFRAVARLLDFA